MIVLKFGGTSVQDTDAVTRAVQVIRRQLSRGEVVVLSAMGKTTNGLLEMARSASSGDIDRAGSIRDGLRDLHLGLARELLSGRRWKSVEASLSGLFQEMTDIVQGLYLLGETSLRSMDRVASFGERLSTLIFSEVLRENGISTELVDSRELIRTDDQFTRASVLQELTRSCVRHQLLPRLREGKVIVAPGFIGSTVDGVTTTIGRGGSDYTASLIGAALDAEDIQIWTDVPGVLTADPRIVPDVYKIRAISFAEAAELAYFGAKVLHPSTLVPAIDRDIPVHVCNSRQIDQPGTFISAAPVSSSSPIKSIACKRGITIVNILSTQMLLSYGFLRRIFEVFEAHETVVDVVATSEVNVSLTVDSSQELEAICSDLAEFGEVRVAPDTAIICTVGEEVKETPGIAARIFGALEGINVQMISQGASRINMTFLVAEETMEEAVRLLHDEFFRQPDPELFERVR
ncbi:MAG: lysine-sensitive aspartokinase 3 [Candidatus Aminicenantes bacterium]|nr:lysine-sensitive aspartokinase 3 [Candidatus Aminicenantes bacterium]